MPPQTLFDYTTLDLNKVAVDQEGIYKVNPHRYEFMLLDAIAHVDYDEGVIVGYKDLTDDQFWVRGHIPGRPLFPGVLMIETAAQLVSYFVMSQFPEKGFMGFGGVDDVKFRGQVVPGDRMVLVGKLAELRTRRCVGIVQGFVNDSLVFQAKITGMWF